MELRRQNSGWVFRNPCKDDGHRSPSGQRGDSSSPLTAVRLPSAPSGLGPSMPAVSPGPCVRGQPLATGRGSSTPALGALLWELGGARGQSLASSSAGPRSSSYGVSGGGRGWGCPLPPWGPDLRKVTREELGLTCHPPTTWRACVLGLGGGGGPSGPSLGALGPLGPDAPPSPGGTFLQPWACWSTGCWAPTSGTTP